MDAKRLEELAAWAERGVAESERRLHAAGESGEWITGGTERHREERCHYADLARCAAAWAKVERMMMAGRGVIELFGYRGREVHWSLYPGGLYASERYTGSTAIAAVEAAPEVTDAK